METTYDTEDIAKPLLITIAVQSKQDIMLMNRDSSADITHSRSRMHLCPTYRLCRKLEMPYRSPMFYDRDQQIAALHDLLQTIKEAALRLIQLIAYDIEERWKRSLDSRACYADSERYNDQQRSPGSGLTLATISYSDCAFCGVALHSKDFSEEARQFKFDGERNENSYDVNISAGMQKKIISKTQSTDTSEIELKSKLLFIRRTSSNETICQKCQDESQRRSDNMTQELGYVASKHRCNINKKPELTKLTQQNSKMAYTSSTISSIQEALTLIHEMFCPCACGLLLRDRTESGISIKSLPVLKEQLIKTNLEESLYLNSIEAVHTEMHDNVRKIKHIKTQKLEKDIHIEHWKELQLQLQTQIEELRKSIRFFKQENAYIRRLVEKCHCSSEKTKILQQLLPIEVTYSGFRIVIKYLQAKCHNKYGIITTLTEMFRDSINIQQIARKLLAPFIQHWHRNSNSNES